MATLTLDGKSLTLAQVDQFLHGGFDSVDVSSSARKAVRKARKFVEKRKMFTPTKYFIP